MEGLINPVADILEKFRQQGKVRTISEEELRAAEKEINDKMALFSLDMKMYFQRSVESARHHYV
jgi:hypothetical protein